MNSSGGGGRDRRHILSFVKDEYERLTLLLFDDESTRICLHTHGSGLTIFSRETVTHNKADRIVPDRGAGAVSGLRTERHHA